MNFDLEAFEPVDIDDEVFLSEVPIDILESSIKEQFNDPLEYRKKDYIQSFITKYSYSVDNMMEDDLVLIEAIHDNFLIFIKNLFYERLHIGFVDLGDIDEDEQHELIHLVYRFFIKNIKKNFVNLVLNYIEENKKEILLSYEKKKDVTSNTFKGELSDEFDVVVITNLDDIINDALDSVRAEEDVEKFLTLCNGKGTCLELEYMKHAYTEAKVTGNFVSEYIDMVDGNFKVEIQSKVRSKILRKYPVRTKRTMDMDDENETNEVVENPETTEDVVSAEEPTPEVEE